MFSSSKPNYLKLRTNLRLCINRLKLLEKKKTELALKARKEIADYISAGKDDRARIRVEHIVREDYMVEAMEITEMFCDLILARFGMIERMKELDPGLEEAIATIIWVTLRLSADVPEFKEVSKQFALKYGKEYAEMCRTNGFENVNEKVMHKLSVSAPPKSLIENYMIEIARTYKVPFEPDEAALVDTLEALHISEPAPRPPGHPVISSPQVGPRPGPSGDSSLPPASSHGLTFPTTPTYTGPAVPGARSPVENPITHPGDLDPSNPGRTDPTNPGDLDPTNPGRTDPTNPGRTDPTYPGDLDPSNPGRTDPINPGDLDPANPGDCDPTNPHDFDPTNPGDCDPSNPGDLAGGGEPHTAPAPDISGLKALHTLPADHFPRGLRIVHLNVRSVCAHHAELATLLRHGAAHVVAVCETWLDARISDAEIHVDGYHVVRRDRNREGGGVMFYISTALRYQVRRFQSQLEQLTIDLHLPDSTSLTVTNIYRPPRDNFREFEANLEDLMAKISRGGTAGKHVTAENHVTADNHVTAEYHHVVLGDFNCDLRKPSAQTRSLLEVMRAHGCRNVIHEPTRVTARSATCLDLVFTSDVTSLITCGVEKVGVSDHFMPYAVFSHPVQRGGDVQGETAAGVQSRLANLNPYSQEQSASEASDLIDLDLMPNPGKKPPGGGSSGGGGGGGMPLGFDGLGGSGSQPAGQAAGGASGGGHAAPDHVLPSVPGAGVFPDSDPPPKTIPPYQAPDTMPARPPSYHSSFPTAPQGYPGEPPAQHPGAGYHPPGPGLPSHPPNAGCNRGLPPHVPNFGASNGGAPNVSETPSLPGYNDVYQPPQVPGIPAAGPYAGGAPTKCELGLPDLPDVPGLPSVPASFPSVGMESAGGDDVDFDDLTKRFEQLKKHK